MQTPYIQFVSILSDSSGASALVVVDGFTFAVDLLGTVRVNLISKTNRVPSARVISAVRSAYTKELSTKVGPEWLTANAALYA